MLSLLLALIAAGCNAVSSVLQRKANSEFADGQSFGLRLLLQLFTKPTWLFGLLAMIVSFLLQATALGIGKLSSVEPVLVLELPLTLVLGAAILHRRMRRSDLMSAAAMAAGLALMIGVLAPHGGDAAHISTVVVALATAATVGGIVVLVLVGRGSHRARAALFGAAAGSGFGLTAALMKLAVSRIPGGGVAGLFAAWETYATVVAGIASVALVQAALHAGTLVAAQPGITLLDPLVSLLWGTVVLGEATRTGPILLLAAVGAAAIVAAAVWLIHASARADERHGDRRISTSAP